MSKNKFCILLSADTPLFAHVRYAEKYLFSGSSAEGIEIKPIGLHGHGFGEIAPQDKYVAERVAEGSYSDERHQRYTVIGGICDPCPASQPANLTVVAAVVKRLGFLLVLPPEFTFSWGNFLRSDIRHIWAHGEFNADKTQPEEPSSTAQALSRNILALFPPKQRRLEKLKGLNYKDMMTPTGSKEGIELIITANFPRAQRLENTEPKQARAIPMSWIFPEWSRVLLSALIVKNGLEQHEQNIIMDIVCAINSTLSDQNTCIRSCE